MSEYRRLFESFPKPKREEWTAAASSEISGGNPADNLRWKTADELDFGPFYSQEDIKGLTYLQQFQLNGLVPEAEPHQWANMPPVRVSDAAKANKTALAHLRQEAEGIIFYLPVGFSDYDVLLNDISWEHCAVSFVGDAAAGKALRAFVGANKLDVTKLQGGFFSTEMIPDGFTITNSPFRFNGILIEPSTPASEIAAALMAGTRIIESSKGTEVATVFRSIGFNLPIGQQLLVEISKLKALRMLWYQVAHAYGVNEIKASDLHIHGRSEPFRHEKFQPHGNMLKSTIAAIAAISGGVSALTIEPEDMEHPMMARIARNVSVILRLESQLGKVHDPFAGAYGIEVLVDKIAQEAWSKFQSQQ
jgi:methylmalonyl-CoA mutase